MSRKDRRAVLFVPLTRSEIRWLRGRARGRSLANVLRRVVETSAPGHFTVSPPDEARQLALQLPARTLSTLRDEARRTGHSLPDLIRAALARAMTSSHDYETSDDK